MNKISYLKAIEPHYSGYQELHVHTVGSYRDAVNTVSDVFDAAEELGRNAIAITDHGNWTRLFEALKERTKREKKVLAKELKSSGVEEADISKIIDCIGPFDSIRNPTDKMMEWIELYPESFISAAKKSIQFIPGIEMYETLPGNEDAHHWHILFLAKDWQGVQALFKLCNLAQLNKRNSLPCCTIETIKEFLGEGSEGYGHVIATSACMAGKIQDTLLLRYNLNEKRKELVRKKEELTSIDPAFIRQAEISIDYLNTTIETLRGKVADMKKLANRKPDTALRRAEKGVQKALAKGGDELKAAQEKLVEAKIFANDVMRAQKLLPELQKELDTKKEELKESKARLAEMIKANAPTQKLQSRIDVIDAEIASLGDTYSKAKAYALEYESIFGKGNFYLELQDHNITTDVLLTRWLIQISEETGIPLTVANDVHYKTPALKRKRDIIAALRFPNLTVADLENQQGSDQMYFKSNEEMAQMFSNIPYAIENTNRIAEQCNVFYSKEMHLPQFEDTKYGLTPEKYLRKMAVDNITKRYPDCLNWTKTKQTEFKKRLNYELDIINRMGYASYISIVEDFIRYSKENFGEESIGPGRGSGAGSLVCYLVGITNIDPLRYNLIFERFLNPERVSMPN